MRTRVISVLVFVVLVASAISSVNISSAQTWNPNNPCPSGVGPGRITAGDYPPQSLSQEQRQWLWNIFGKNPNETAPVGYGGERCGGNFSQSPERSFFEMVCEQNRNARYGPRQIRIGSYDPYYLTQEERQWLWNSFHPTETHTGASVGYGGERCPWQSGNYPNPTTPQPAPVPAPAPVQPQNPNPPPAGSGGPATSISNINIDGYCRAFGYTDGVTALGNYPRDFYCKIGERIAEINLSAACKWQYGDSWLNVGLRDGNNPNSWYCSQTPVSIANGPASPRPANVCPNNINGWQCSQYTFGGGSTGGSSSSSTSGCSNAPTQYLRVGDTIEIDVDPGSTLKLRSNASTSGRIIAELQRGTQANIIGGPECANGYRWWQLRYDFGTTGWSADGSASDGDTWMRQVSSSISGQTGVQALPPPNNPNLGRYGNGWCWAIPEEAGYFGRSGINPQYQLYFAGETNLGHVIYYLYYMDNYVGPNIAFLEGENSSRGNQWQVGVDTTWATRNEPWWRTETNWRADYRCG